MSQVETTAAVVEVTVADLRPRNVNPGTDQYVHITWSDGTCVNIYPDLAKLAVAEETPVETTPAVAPAPPAPVEPPKVEQVEPTIRKGGRRKASKPPAAAAPAAAAPEAAAPEAAAAAPEAAAAAPRKKSKRDWIFEADFLGFCSYQCLKGDKDMCIISRTKTKVKVAFYVTIKKGDNAGQLAVPPLSYRWEADIEDNPKLSEVVWV